MPICEAVGQIFGVPTELTKSSAARSILGAKLLEDKKFKLRRYAPSAGSRKDYWRVAPTWRSYPSLITLGER
ncbi:MAG: hypothetical protein AAGF98_13020 [Cyanobacteria bacterium P01_H01_bin.153]